LTETLSAVRTTLMYRRRNRHVLPTCCQQRRSTIRGEKADKIAKFWFWGKVREGSTVILGLLQFCIL